MKTLRTFLTLFLLPAFCSVGVAETFLYDFADQVSSSTSWPGIQLEGQDNWELYAQGASTSYIYARRQTLSDNVERVWALQYSASGIYNDQVTADIRPNDTNFSYTIQPEDTQVTLSMLVRGQDAFASYFGLRYKDAGGTLVTGPLMGTTYDNQYAIVGADGTRTSVSHNLGDTQNILRMVMVIDLTANGGDGSGSLFVENLTAGTSLSEVAGLQDINLSLNSIPAATEWDGIFLRTQKLGACVADLSITTAVIPEPLAMGLLCVGGTFLTMMRRRRK